ncbi:HNH endonuclease signature motif containing protein [Streptomyces sp. AK04-4c]|uniref:HNH endonuclease signature motif containing protein n=1 Tax=unclassified Streptomyces TaxID=2593676 RepID=UPI0029BBCD28|nr:HNH endonuclease signature motif containing protein [Streptomyces sp. AK04-4c]MDX3687184.1 HNH endonuclease signature motif containing protein [Streptomyces sp. AK04-4c]
MPVSPYTRERLAEAASSSRTLSEALTKLGVDPKSSTRRYLLARMRRLGVDTRHFESEGVRWTKEVLQEAVTASTTMCEVLQRLGLEVVGGQHTHISRRVKALGIDTSHFAAPPRKGEVRRRRPEELLVDQTQTLVRRIPGERLKRAMIAVGAPERCARCGTGPVWRHQPLPLEVDHVDGNWRNNQPQNLRLLCPNCHSTTDTYRGRGKGRRAPLQSEDR